VSDGNFPTHPLKLGASPRLDAASSIFPCSVKGKPRQQQFRLLWPFPFQDMFVLVTEDGMECKSEDDKRWNGTGYSVWRGKSTPSDNGHLGEGDEIA